MPKDFKDSSEKFKTEMGFESCDLKPSIAKDNELIVPKDLIKNEGKCDTKKGDTYHCTTYVDPKSKEIIKSDCDKQ